jgi:hypothetical protein
MGGHVKFKKKQLKDVLCRKGYICSLSDVICGISSGIDIGISYNGFFIDSARKPLCKWDTAQDDIYCQSDATVAFVYDLIVNKKISPSVITDPQLLKEYSLFLENQERVMKLIEKGICPECGFQLDVIHDGSKECHNCGFLY